MRHIVKHKLTFQNVANTVTTSRLQDIIKHIINNQESTDLSIFWHVEVDTNNVGS